jgi:hypothetical protein
MNWTNPSANLGVPNMPGKTQGELIRELQSVVTALTERVDNLRGDRDRHEAALNRLTESVAALSNRVSVLEHQVAELRKTIEEGGRRWWSLLPALGGGACRQYSHPPWAIASFLPAKMNSEGQQSLVLPRSGARDCSRAPLRVAANRTNVSVPQEDRRVCRSWVVPCDRRTCDASPTRSSRRRCAVGANGSA